ncbi:Glycerophosphocholine phosphodiesterase [Orbilia ellipsospora]|uniref:Glycerophosphocholine phosphodiesterase n=1 Tax=Orbilia ellipsospora TaxID=2528407 RepID=A0AAV9WQW7_9PEZI
MTKDLVPVVYHDFLVPETGIDAQIHTITLDQLTALSNTPSESMPPQVIANDASAGLVSEKRSRKTRSNSWDPNPPQSINDLADRVKKTLIYNARGFNPNTRGHHIKEPFATLEQILDALPSSVGFDIEIKYPTLFDRDMWQLVPFAIELNIFVDGILDKIFEKDSDREIVISSFSPEICILASLKQSKYPVLHLTRGGYFHLWDERARSLRAGIHFAKAWNLLGTITVCNPILACPKLVGTIKQNGLVCGSYGGGNNVSENAKTQAEAGLDVIVVDRFALILKTLQESGYTET